MMGLIALVLVFVAVVMIGIAFVITQGRLFQTSFSASPSPPSPTLFIKTLIPTVRAASGGTVTLPTPNATAKVTTTVGAHSNSNAEMVYVAAGEFMMGSDGWSNEEKPVHRVYLDAFSIDRFEVTNRDYRLCVEAGTCQLPSPRRYYDKPEFANHPIVSVTWHDAYVFCGWAGKRLPTEAEWEKAARGTDGRIYPWGNEFEQSYVNSNDVVGNTMEVGKYPSGASPYGALDMAGNVSEWVADWYDAKYYSNSPPADPTGPTSGQYHVYRGGSYPDGQDQVRVTRRSPESRPNARASNFGFRCAQSA